MTIPNSNLTLSLVRPCFDSGLSKYAEARIVRHSMTMAPIDEVMAILSENNATGVGDVDMLILCVLWRCTEMM